MAKRDFKQKFQNVYEFSLPLHTCAFKSYVIKFVCISGSKSTWNKVSISKVPLQCVSEGLLLCQILSQNVFYPLKAKVRFFAIVSTHVNVEGWNW